MIGRTADHALRALLLLAGEREAGRCLRADEVARATGAPRNYMSKVLGIMAKAGLIRSSRGPTGGFRLARTAHTISIGAVVDVFDTPSPNARCLNGDAPCNRRRPCAAHRRWVSVMKAQRAPLDATTIADLVDIRPAPIVRSRPHGHNDSAPHNHPTKERPRVIR